MGTLRHLLGFGGKSMVWCEDWIDKLGSFSSGSDRTSIFPVLLLRESYKA
jgi:hypothetical protein